MYHTFGVASGGAGLRFNQFRAVQSVPSERYSGPSPFSSGDTTATYRGDEDLTITFIGPVFTYRLISDNNKHLVWASLSFGYVHISKKSKFLSGYKISAHSAGYNFLNGGYDFMLRSNLAIGLNAGLDIGFYGNYKIEYSDGTSDINKGSFYVLHRLNLMLGARYFM
jgi:hypothetical protein